jgi:molybdopterin-guanine dinucleotide biosynthesis protein A
MAQECAGFVLVGGRSSRMGYPKGLLAIGGETLAARTARLLASVASPVTLVGAPDLYGNLGHEVIPDDFDGLGPLAGILTALRSTTAEWNLVVACDMPGLTIDFLEHLSRRARASPVDCVVPRTTRLEPLCATYRKSCHTPLDRARRQGIRKLLDALSGLRVEVWQAPDPEPLRNVNTPAQWEEFLHNIHKTRGG